jgi:hypothetical protein
MTKSQRLCNGKVAANAGKCDKVVKLVQRCNNQGLVISAVVIISEAKTRSGALCRVKAKSFSAW